MCACEPGWTCSSCRDTPADPHYEDWERPQPVYSEEPWDYDSRWHRLNNGFAVE